jgi:hypothetical protein
MAKGINRDVQDVHELRVQKEKEAHYTRHIHKERKKRAHDKVDPKMERFRGIEGRAFNEPFGAKCHPPAVQIIRSASACLIMRVGGSGNAYPPYGLAVQSTTIQ